MSTLVSHFFGSAVLRLEGVPCEADHVLVAEQELVVVLTLLVESRSQLKMVEEVVLVHQELAALLLVLVHAA